MSTLTRMAFDHPDMLNEDGSVTFRFCPSSWRNYNLSPDTYQLFNGEHWEEQVLEYIRENEEVRPNITYDDVDWTYDHAGVVKGLSDALCEWIEEHLRDECGLTSVRDAKVTDTGSPREYNFTSDWFEMELTCDPAELRALTPDFLLEDWVRDFYDHCDGFISWVPSRIEKDSWHAEYDAAFRIEQLIAAQDPRHDDDWRYALWEVEYEVYDEHCTYVVIEPYVEGTPHTYKELSAWAATLVPTQPETLF